MKENRHKLQDTKLEKWSTEITLDWDSISFKDARLRFVNFVEQERPLSARLDFSPLKGYHVRAHFGQRRPNWNLRDKWKDDGYRLVHEMLKDNHDEREFFWNGKLLGHWNFEEEPIACFTMMQYSIRSKLASGFVGQCPNRRSHIVGDYLLLLDARVDSSFYNLS